MILLIFATLFSGMCFVFLHMFKKAMSQDTRYVTKFIKGTTRGAMSLFDSNSALELNRRKLQRKNSKF